MKVSDLLNKIKYLEALKTSVRAINDDHHDALDTEDRITLDDAAEAIDGYIDELLYKDVKI